MFEDYSYSCGISSEVDSSEAAGSGVQSIRVTPIQGGAWCLPSLHSDIPLQINCGATDTDDVIARFALEANDLGVPLPDGDFATADNTLKLQWDQYIKAVCGNDSPLNMSMHVQVTNAQIAVGISPPGSINFLRMRPLIESLNSAMGGLGWWAYGLTCAASGDYYPIYGPIDYADFLTRDMWVEDFTDKAVVDAYNEMESTELTREEIEAANKPFWPSELIAAVDGHTWMLGRSGKQCGRPQKSTSRGTRPKPSTLADAKRFLREGNDVALMAAVRSFLELHTELQRSDSRMRLAEQGDRPMTEDWSDEEEEAQYQRDSETLGASCALVWEASGIAVALIQANEIRLMESGEHVDDHIRFTSKSLKRSDLRELIISMKDFVRRHVAISKAFAHFEVIDDSNTN